MSERINLEHQVSELFRLKLEEFAEWAAANWTISDLQAKADNVFDTKPDGYREGFNAAIEGLPTVIECFLEERP